MALTSLPMLTLVLCQFTYDWVVFLIVHDLPRYFQRFLNLDIKIVRIQSLSLPFIICTSYSWDGKGRYERVGVHVRFIEKPRHRPIPERF